MPLIGDDQPAEWAEEEVTIAPIEPGGPPLVLKLSYQSPRERIRVELPGGRVEMWSFQEFEWDIAPFQYLIEGVTHRSASSDELRAAFYLIAEGMHGSIAYYDEPPLQFLHREPTRQRGPLRLLNF